MKPAPGRNATRRPKGFGGRLKAALRWVFRSATRAVVVIVALAIVVIAISPWRTTVRHKISSAFTSVRRTIAPSYDPVHPVQAAASSTLAATRRPT